MSANERQVGGTHYQSNYIHWDWVLAIRMGYLEANATKYLARWDKKGVPLQDLEKALHYVEKLIECAPLCIEHVNRMRPSVDFVTAETGRFLRANKIVAQTAAACWGLALWTTTDRLVDAAANIRVLIGLQQHFQANCPPAKPVPLEDSNKHADRLPRNHSFESDEH